MQHMMEGASNGSTSPVRHRFSKSFTDASIHSQAGHHLRGSIDAKRSFDESADGPSWGRLGGDSASPPRNLLTQAAFQVLRESDDIDSVSTGVHRGRPPRRNTGLHTSTNVHGPPHGQGDMEPASRGRSSTSLASSPYHSRQHSWHGSVGSANASFEGTRPKGRPKGPGPLPKVGFGSGAASSRAVSGLHTRNTSAPGAERTTSSTSPARRVSNAGSLRTSDSTLSRRQSTSVGAGRGRINIQDQGRRTSARPMDGLGSQSMHRYRHSTGVGGLGSSRLHSAYHSSTGGSGIGRGMPATGRGGSLYSRDSRQ